MKRISSILSILSPSPLLTTKTTKLTLLLQSAASTTPPNQSTNRPPNHPATPPIPAIVKANPITAPPDPLEEIEIPKRLREMAIKGVTMTIHTIMIMALEQERARGSRDLGVRMLMRRCRNLKEGEAVLRRGRRIEFTIRINLRPNRVLH